MYRLQAKDVMSHSVITVRLDTPVAEIARTMIKLHISGLPVLDDRGRLVGIVTEGDLVEKEAGPVPYPKMFGLSAERAREVEDRSRRSEGKVAADVMTREVITTKEDTPLREIARVMAERKINRMPIVRDGEVLGIVSRQDVLKAFARPDHELAQLVRDVIVKDLWSIDPSTFEITAKNGVIRFAGRVEKLSEAELLEWFARGVDGVVDVDRSGLAYDVDDRTPVAARTAAR